MFRISTLLTGCLVMMLTVLVWSGHATAQTDEQIKVNVVQQLHSDARIDASDVTVEVNSGNVTLRGEVPTYLAATEATDVALGINGVISVANRLTVSYSPDFIVPTDLDLRKSIENRLATNPDIDVQNLEIEVAAGVVTLRGTVDSYWKTYHAEDLVADEPGVILIRNHLAVVPTEEYLDQDIAESIVQSLESRVAVSADDVDVRVEDGRVTLSGSVPSWTAKREAYRAALFTLGVLEVDNLIIVVPPKG